MPAYYNEHDPATAQWLRNLIFQGLIAPGVVDERSIEDVAPSDLIGFTQVHLFAGIGGWSLALRNAGWPDDKPVWTGSCPCQPFSAAGAGLAFDDPRHLWPAMFWLARFHKPDVIFGEQVDSKAALAWLDLVFTDLEGEGYACGATDFCAASVGAPHRRQRLYWVADATSGKPSDRDVQRSGQHGLQPEGSGTLGMADTEHPERRTEQQIDGDPYGRDGPGRSGYTGPVVNPDDKRREAGRRTEPGQQRRFDERESVGGLGNAEGDNQRWTSEPGCNGQRVKVGGSGSPRILGDTESIGRIGREDDGDGRGRECSPGHPGPTNGFWRDAQWLPCTDGKARPVEPGTSPLAHGVSGRVVALRAFGNAIVPPQATEFIEAYKAIRGL